MKTTIDLPPALLREAKITAARRRTSLKNLVVEGLEYIIHGQPVSFTGNTTDGTVDTFFEKDAYGVPVLKHREVTVTNEWIDRIRNEEGI